MVTSVEGKYRNGRVELTETPENVPEGATVMVTFVQPSQANLSDHGIDQAQAAKIRGQLASFSEEWDSPEMDFYDNYDAVNPVR